MAGSISGLAKAVFGSYVASEPPAVSTPLRETARDVDLVPHLRDVL